MALRFLLIVRQKNQEFFLNNKYIGTTPYYGIFEPGDYILTISKAGYETKELRSQFTENGINKYYVELNETKKSWLVY